MRYIGDKYSSFYYEVDTSLPPLGVGGMGRVYKGDMIDRRSKTHTPVAIKFLFDDLKPKAIERAKREASVRIEHENLIRMYDFLQETESLPNGKVITRSHVISELLIGITLQDFLSGKKTDQQGNRFRRIEELSALKINSPELFTIHIVREILTGLYMLHSHGYIHRDIDPSNIMLTNDGKIKIIDFGVAKQIREKEGNEFQLTDIGQFVGKTAYASPEQYLGDIPHQNETTDIYSVGMIAYQLVTGKQLQTADNISSGPQRSDYNKIRDKRLRRIIKKATNRLQHDRYRTAAEFLVDIDRYERPNNKLQYLYERILALNANWFFLASFAITAIIGLIVIFFIKR